MCKFLTPQSIESCSRYFVLRSEHSDLSLTMSNTSMHCVFIGRSTKVRNVPSHLHLISRCGWGHPASAIYCSNTARARRCMPSFKNALTIIMNCCNTTRTNRPLQSFEMSFWISNCHSIAFIAYGKASNLKLKFHSFPTLNYVPNFGGLQNTSNPSPPLWVRFRIPCFVAQSQNVKHMYFFQTVLPTLTLSQDLPYIFQGYFGDPVLPRDDVYKDVVCLMFRYVYVRRWEFEDNPSTNGTAIVGVDVWLLSCPLLPTGWLEPIIVGLHWRSTCIFTVMIW